MSWCLNCHEDFRYDDTGGYNPPARCGEHCRFCCEGDCHEERDTDDWQDYEIVAGVDHEDTLIGDPLPDKSTLLSDQSAPGSQP